MSSRPLFVFTGLFGRLLSSEKPPRRTPRPLPQAERSRRDLRRSLSQEKTVLISGKEVRFRSSAAIPRLYRIKFKRDIFKDLTKLEKSYKGKTDEGEEMQIEDLEIGLSMSDLDLLTIGMVLDIWTEKGNDEYEYGEKEAVRTAGQKDFDNF